MLKNDLQQYLIQYKTKHGILPMKKTINTSIYNQCKIIFGSWSAALYETFGKVNKNFPWNKELILLRIRDLQIQLNRKPKSSDNWGITSAAQKYFGSWNKALQIATGSVNKKRYLDEYLKTSVTAFISVHHRLPLREEFDGQEYPYWEAVANYWGETKWSNIYKHINLSNLIIKFNKKHGTGFISVFDNNLYLSHQELLIGKYLTKNHIVFKKEVPYENSLHIFDFYLSELNVYIEYYGLATEDYQNKISEKRKFYNDRIVWEIFKHDNTVKKLHEYISQGSETIIVQAN